MVSTNSRESREAGDYSLFNSVARGPRARFVACPFRRSFLDSWRLSGPRDVIIPGGRVSPPMRVLWAAVGHRLQEEAGVLS